METNGPSMSTQPPVAFTQTGYESGHKRDAWHAEIQTSRTCQEIPATVLALNQGRAWSS